MKTEDKESIKSKAFSINSLMRNKDLAKVISDSWNSKVGSTKNDEARAILKSVHRAKSNYNYIILVGSISVFFVPIILNWGWHRWQILKLKI